MRMSAVNSKQNIGEVSQDLWQIAQDAIRKGVGKGLYHPY